MTLAPGIRLGPYEIVGTLGAGGMGEVFRAHDSQLGRDVAIKVLPSSFSRDPDRLLRFEQEAANHGSAQSSEYRGRIPTGNLRRFAIFGV